jgi:tetratricopeptide (TPR) repeat protein/transglutaminase-like putative cysteine protease
MTFPRARPALAALALFLLSSSAFLRAEDWPIARGASHEPVPYRYHASQWKTVPRDFLEEAPACTLYSGVSYLVEADGTVETITHEITRFNGRKGIEKLGEYRGISYDPSYETLTLNVARVLKADGRAAPIEAKHVQLRDVSTDYQVYDHSKQLVISFPNLEVGDAIEVEWTTRGKNPEYHGHFFTRYTFGDDRYPVVRDELRVRLPRERTLKYASVGGRLEPIIRDDGDTRTYFWKALHQRQLPHDDYLPSKETLRLQVACSTFASWDEVFRWKQRLRADCWNCTAEVRHIVQDVTRGLKTPIEKARALTYWVRRHIRYVSSGEKHDYTPHAPALVCANRYGDCKDQSQLLAVMLRHAEVPVALVTLGALDDGQILSEVPSPWGTHAILLVTIDGKEHWIDTTISLAAWDYLPRDDRERQVYVIDEKGLRLMRTPGITPRDNRIEQTTHLSIGADGSSRLERELRCVGAAALARRDDWMEVPAGERRRLMTAELQDANSRSRLRDLVIDQQALQDFDQPVRARIVYEIAGHFSGDPDREGSLTDSTLWGKLLSLNLDYDRRVPLELPAPFESIHRYVVQLPPGYRLESPPQNHTVRSQWGSFRLSVSTDPNLPRQLELEFRTRIEQSRVAPEDFEKYRRFHETIVRHYRVWLTLKPVHNLADATDLEALLALAPGDSTSAALLVRLYLQHGKMSDARRVLRRARAYHPDDLGLAELSVKAVEDAQEEEAAYRDLIRRFPEEVKYCVALGQALVDRARYAAAREVLRPIAQKGPLTWRGQAHYQLARCCMLEDRAGMALKHLESAGKVDAESVSSVAAWQLRGRVYTKLGRSHEAADAYRQALKIDPDSEESLAALVEIALADGQPREALDSLRRYTLAASKSAAGLCRAADFHLRLGRLDDAVELASRAREQKASPVAERILGSVYLQRGDHRRALPHLERADKDGPVLTGLIGAQLALGNLGEAERWVEEADKIKEPATDLARSCAVTRALLQRRAALRRALAAPPDRAEQWSAAIDAVVSAEHAQAIGRPAAQVETLLAPALADGTALGPAVALRGLLALEKGNLWKARADADRAVQLAPGEARGYYLRGRVRLERGENGALADLTRAAELTHWKDAAVLHWLATAMFRGGCINEALKMQQRAVKLRPGDAEMTEQLKEFEKAEQSSNSGSEGSIRPR